MTVDGDPHPRAHCSLCAYGAMNRWVACALRTPSEVEPLSAAPLLITDDPAAGGSGLRSASRAT